MPTANSSNATRSERSCSTPNLLRGAPTGSVQPDAQARRGRRRRGSSSESAFAHKQRSQPPLRETRIAAEAAISRARRRQLLSGHKRPRRRGPCENEAGLARHVAAHLLFDNLETRRVVSAPAHHCRSAGVPLWHELGYGVGPRRCSPKALADRLSCGSEQTSGAAALVTEQAPSRSLGSLPIWTTRGVSAVEIQASVSIGLDPGGSRPGRR